MDRRRDVRETYDRIAAHFSRTREHPWPEVTTFVDGADSARVALDLGCGNGRHAELLATRAAHVVGIDLSGELLATARLRADERAYADRLSLVQGDAASLPLADGTVDIAVYIAALHHLPTRTDRVRSLDELARVLRGDGRALVSVWAVTHGKFDADEGFDTTVDWTLPDGETVERFYHVYDLAEFRRDIGASRLGIESVYESEGNCYAVVTGRP